MVQDALSARPRARRRRNRPMLVAMAGGLAVVLAAAPRTMAQTAAEHAEKAHGRPIVGGHPVEPNPAVVEERLRHHRQMLEAEKAEGPRSTVPRAQPGAAPSNRAPAVAR